MTWQLVYTISNSALNGNAIWVPYYFNSSLLIVEAVCLAAKPSWHEAGYLKLVKSISSVGDTKKYLGRLFLEKQYMAVDIERLNLQSYTLEFIPKDWIPSITLNFWESDELINSNMNQYLSNSRLLGVGI